MLQSPKKAAFCLLATVPAITRPMSRPIIFNRVAIVFN